MANEEHVALLKQGREVWNRWRQKNPNIRPDLTGAYLRAANLAEADLDEATLRRADLTGANLTKASLTGAKLRGVNLAEAKLTEAKLTGANLDGANLAGADLTEAKLGGANLGAANLTGVRLDEATLRMTHLGAADLTGATLRRADLTGAHLDGASLGQGDLTEATLFETVFGNTNLSNVKGLDSCIHVGPSIIDHRTLQRSGPLPLIFLRGVGLPNNLIDYLPSLLNQPIQFFSCFISYSSKDQKFADRLHADLQNKGVRCWFAPHDLAIGARTWDTIDEAIRLRDKVLLILSKSAIESDWVEDEVTKAFAEERTRKQLVLFPIRLDDTVMKTTEAWASKLRDNRNIGDFRKWKDHDAYEKALERVLRDLKMTRDGS
jgi:uncharacterized protein YjbI with pentapeptide repeats